ncbi:glycoside hydrolase family 9 protein [Halococcoides cellulosivorans]|uniref:Uncharacterized protein n=1 Tax=Halococcoides cellulosivorans TaxID=1679096 RepID=A0A2R4X158_9EURY|nr:glycoside hydrolase family 9 protein [Halococcoides cellulosivorans]AWB27528.1 hypothetical protein HARCEL1_07310 [Halococcoides cellulosivorans]
MVDMQPQNRRTVLKSVGGLTAAGVLGTSAGTALAAPSWDESKAIRVNQVGYATDMQKVAIVSSGQADLASVSSFEVVDVETGDAVESGTLSDAVEDTFYEGVESSGHSVKYADFTGLTTSGTYKVVAGSYESHEFEVGSAKEVYGRVLSDVGRVYTLKRANADITDPVTGLDIGPGHMQDQEAVIPEPATSDFLVDDSPGDTIDVTGGWYDAGDYGKYVITTGITAAQLMLAYERNPDAFGVGDFAIPDSIDDPHAGDMPDVLAEAAWGLRFLAKMQRSDGALYFKVAADDWSPEVPPEEDTDLTRKVYGLSSAGTAQGVGAFAVAARVFEGVDDQLASDMLDAAKAGAEWLQNNPDVVWEKSVNQDGGSGGYTRNETDTGDRYWAYAELLRTTGDSTYADAIGNLPDYETYNGSVSLPAETATQPVDWPDAVSLGQYAYGMYGIENNVSDSAVTAARTALQKQFWIQQRYNPNNTQVDYNDAYTTGLYDYYWGCVKSGVSRAVQGRWGFDTSTVNYVGPDADGAEWIMSPLHHALGRSATGYSYVTDWGSTSTQAPHDRMIQSTETLIPGMLVGGPHNNVAGIEGDCTEEEAGLDTPNALSYVDQHCSFATNEWAINYSAPLFGALAEVDGITAVPPEADPEPTPDEPDWPTNPAATDPDGDGKYEDVNGNGKVDFPDVNTLFQNTDTASQQGNLEFYDFNGDGGVDLDDVLALFELI